MLRLDKHRHEARVVVCHGLVAKRVILRRLVRQVLDVVVVNQQSVLGHYVAQSDFLDQAFSQLRLVRSRAFVFDKSVPDDTHGNLAELTNVISAGILIDEPSQV